MVGSITLNWQRLLNADTYQANQVKPRVDAIGYQTPSGNKPRPVNSHQATHSNKPHQEHESVLPSVTPSGIKACFKCKSQDHLFRDCPKRFADTQAESSMTSGSYRPKTKPQFKARANRATAVLSDKNMTQNISETLPKMIDSSESAVSRPASNDAVNDDVSANARVSRCSIGK